MWVEIIFFPLQQTDKKRVKIIYQTSHFTSFTTPVKLLEKTVKQVVHNRLIHHNTSYFYPLATWSG